jgi:hypothetical protein
LVLHIFANILLQISFSGGQLFHLLPSPVYVLEISCCHSFRDITFVPKNWSVLHVGDLKRLDFFPCGVSFRPFLFFRIESLWFCYAASCKELVFPDLRLVIQIRVFGGPMISFLAVGDLTG